MASFKHKVGLGIRVLRQLVYRYFFYNWSTDIWSTGIWSTTSSLPRLSVWDSHTSNFCFSKSLFSSIPTST